MLSTSFAEVSVGLDGYNFTPSPSDSVGTAAKSAQTKSAPTLRASKPAQPAPRRESTESARSKATEVGSSVNSEGALDATLSGDAGKSAMNGTESGASAGGRKSAHGSGSSRNVSSRHPKNNARLMPGTAACSDLFPRGANTTRTEVTATLAVDPGGRAKLVRLDRAHPLAFEVEAAARACTKRLHFEPARDARGRAMASVAKVKLHFRREG